MSRPQQHPLPADERTQLVEVAKSSIKHRALAGFIVGAALTAALVTFMVQNTSGVDFEWLMFDFNVPAWLTLLGGFIGGVVVGPLLVAAMRHSHEVRRDRQKLVTRARGA